MVDQKLAKNTLPAESAKAMPPEFAKWPNEQINHHLARRVGHRNGYYPYVRCPVCKHKAALSRVGKTCQNSRPGQATCTGVYVSEPKDFVKTLDRVPELAQWLNVGMSVTLWPNGQAEAWVVDMTYGITRRIQAVPQEELGHRLAALVLDVRDLSDKLRSMKLREPQGH